MRIAQTTPLSRRNSSVLLAEAVQARVKIAETTLVLEAV
jgi:hypothetical protein